ncbi:MAG: hypothetical protein RSG58_03070 [Eubacterium sp.]
MDSEKDKMKNKAAYDFKGIKTTCGCLKMDKKLDHKTRTKY